MIQGPLQGLAADSENQCLFWDSVMEPDLATRDSDFLEREN
jgi:hypothetical protein